MQSTTKKIEFSPAPETNRPEPFINDRVSTVGDHGFVAVNDTHRVDGSRTGLAAAFRRFGHGMQPRAAFDAVGMFYRASGHAWARSLSA